MKRRKAPTRIDLLTWYIYSRLHMWITPIYVPPDQLRTILTEFEEHGEKVAHLMLYKISPEFKAEFLPPAK